MQQRALNAIEHARTHSKSALAFMDKLAAINQRVDDLVPEGERQVLHQLIAINYYKAKGMNKLVRTGYLPGKSEYRPKKIKTGTTMAFNNTSLLDLTKIAHADGEVEVLPEIVIVVPASNSGDGVSWSDWYQLQDTYGNGYEDGYEDGSNDDEESWWGTYSECIFASGNLLASFISLVAGCNPPALGATLSSSCVAAGLYYVSASVSVGLACDDI